MKFEMNELPSEYQAEVGERIRRMRKHARLTQSKFAEQLGVTTSQLAKIEIGYQPASDRVIDLVVEKLSVDKEWLTTGQGQSPDPEEDRRISGASIRRLREQLQMSREDLAGRIGVKPSTLHNVELGHQRLGPAATNALLQLAKQSQEAPKPIDEKMLDAAIERAIEETYKVMCGPQAMEAVKSLTAAIGDDELTIVKNLVKNKVRGAAREDSSR